VDEGPASHLDVEQDLIGPLAIFLLMMELAMRGMLFTVAVTSRRA
jgi:hypothetical protein